jgi:hypothetical protein
VFGHSSARHLHGVDYADDLFPTVAAKCLAHLHRRSTSIAEHLDLPRSLQPQKISR